MAVGSLLAPSSMQDMKYSHNEVRQRQAGRVTVLMSVS